MALTQNHTVAEAQAILSVSNLTVEVFNQIRQLLDHNSDLSIDWSAVTKPDYITEDADGNIEGMKVTRAEVSNAIFSLEQISRVLTNLTSTQGDHLGNLNKLATPNTARISVRS